MRYLVLAMLVAGCSAQGLPEGSARVRFYDDVQQDIKAHCAGCHNGNLPANVPIFRADDTAELGANYAIIVDRANSVGWDADRLRHHDGDGDLWRTWVEDGALK